MRRAIASWLTRRTNPYDGWWSDRIDRAADKDEMDTAIDEAMNMPKLVVRADRRSDG